MTRAGITFLLLALCPLSVNAATLSSPELNARPGEEVTLAVTLACGAAEQVAGLQFDLQYDASALSIRATEAGTVATAAGKLVSANALGSGRHRVIIAGLNQTGLANGELLRIRFGVSTSAASGRYPLSLSGVVLSDPAGKRLPGDVAVGDVVVSGGSVAAVPVPRAGCGCMNGGTTAQAGLGDVLTFAVGALVLAAAWSSGFRGKI